MLELTNRKRDDADVVAAKGRLDAATSRLFESHCGGLLLAGCKSLVVDFRDLHVLNSDGLRAILALSKRIRAGGGKLVFTGVRGPIRDMFNIAGFLDEFPVVDEVESQIV